MTTQDRLPTIKEFMDKSKAKKARKLNHSKQNAKISKLVGTMSIVEFIPISKLKEKVKTVIAERVKIRGKRRTGGYCEKCHVNLIYSANHILPKGNYRGVEFDMDNLYAGCAKCNQSEVFNRLEHNAYWRSVLGNEKMDAMAKRGKENRYTRDELYAILRDET